MRSKDILHMCKNHTGRHHESMNQHVLIHMMCSHLLKQKLPPHTLTIIDQTQSTWFVWSLCVVDFGLPLVGNNKEDALQLLAPRIPEIWFYVASQPVTKLCKGRGKLFWFQLMWIGNDREKCNYQLRRQKHCMLLTWLMCTSFLWCPGVCAAQAEKWLLVSE